ncbi:class I SAM-dependent methyltransferase [Pseudarthrobacter sp. L19]|uniref:class I SAM-dependent methyltransferase n=1 Tax=Pseudarthrobacter sp. L19 TaxID=3423951 RepID=UPI003D7AE0E0
MTDAGDGVNSGRTRRAATDYDAYAAKMRRLVESGRDMEADARFVDTLVPRGAVILDVGCGIGSAVAALRERGHEAFGIDATPAVLEVATECHDPAWFRKAAAADLSIRKLGLVDLPTRYDAIVVSGNVPAFLTDAELGGVFDLAAEILVPAGQLVIGTTTQARGGPATQDELAVGAGLGLSHRFSDWHLGAFCDSSPWSVSVFTNPGARRATSGPDGMFILNS